MLLIRGALLTVGVAQWCVAGDPFSVVGWLLYAVAGALIVRAPRSDATFDVGTFEAAAAENPLRAELLLLSVFAMTVAVLFAARDILPLPALMLWLAAMVSASVALQGHFFSRPLRLPAIRLLHLLWLSAVLIVAAVARFAWIDELPGRYFDDEARVGRYLVGLSGARVRDWFDIGWNAWPIPGMVLQGIFLRWVEIPTTALRLSSALMGTVAVASTFYLGRTLFSARVGILAALLLAINRTAIDVSRTGTCHAQVMALAPLALAFWWSGLRTGSAARYLWAGLTMALCLHTYNAGQLIPVGWALLAVATALFAPARARGCRRGALLTLAALVLASMPLLSNVTDELRFDVRWRQWTEIARNRSVLSEVLEDFQSREISAGLRLIRHQISRTWLGFFAVPSQAYELGYRDGGMSDHITAALFFFGLIMSFAGRFGVSGAFLAYWWLIITVLAGVMTRNPPVFQRMVAVVPLVALMAAVALDDLQRFFAARGSRRLALSAVALMSMGAVWLNWRTYFVEFAHQRLDLTSALARHLRTLPASRPVLLFGAEYVWHPAGWWLNPFNFDEDLFKLDFPARRLIQVEDPTSLLPVRQLTTDAVSVILGPLQMENLELLQTTYPEAVVARKNPNLFAFVDVPTVSLAAQLGLELSAASASSIVSFGPRDPTIAAPDLEPQRMKSDGAIWRWKGRVYWPTDAPIDLRVRKDVPFDLYLDGKLIHAKEPLPRLLVTIRLPMGWHTILLEEKTLGKEPWQIFIGTRRLTLSDFSPTAELRGVVASFRDDEGNLRRQLAAQVNMVADERLARRRPDASAVPMQARWKGRLRVETAGTYALAMRTDGLARVTLDGEDLLVADQMANPTADPTQITVERNLEPRDYDLAASWVSKKGNERRVFQLLWKPPGRQWQLIPPANLAPPPHAILPKVSAAQGRWCADDCNGDGFWTVEEIVTMLNIALGTRQLDQCSTGDTSSDGIVTADELIAAQHKAMVGCLD